MRFQKTLPEDNHLFDDNNCLDPMTIDLNFQVLLLVAGLDVVIVDIGAGGFGPTY